jgi:hypothetical protein
VVAADAVCRSGNVNFLPCRSIDLLRKIQSTDQNLHDADIPRPMHIAGRLPSIRNIGHLMSTTPKDVHLLITGIVANWVVVGHKTDSLFGT